MEEMFPGYGDILKVFQTGQNCLAKKGVV